MKALVQGGQRSNPFQILLYENGSPQDAPLKQELLSSSFLPPPPALPPHYFNSSDLESNAALRVGERDVIYCDLLFPDGAIKRGRAAYICAGFSSDFYQHARTALSPRAVPNSAASAHKEARLMLN